MRHIGRHIWAVVLLGFLLGGPACSAFAQHVAERHVGSAAGGHLGHGGDGGAHHDPVQYGPLHCLFSSCVPTLPASAGAGAPYERGGMTAVIARADNALLRATYLEHDPPVPRPSA